MLAYNPDVDRDRGGGHPPTPPTPPCIRVRTRRFETFGLTLLEQRRKTTIAEIGIRKRDIQSFRMGQMPWAMTTAGGVIGQPTTHTQLNQHRPATALGFPLPPQRSPKAQPNPASQIDQHVRRFAESEIATPTPHIRSQSRHRRLQAHAFGLPCDFPNPFLKPLDGLRRNPPPNHGTVAETESEKLPLLRSRHRALLVVHLELESLRDESRDAIHHSLTRPFAADVDITVVRISNETMSPALQLPVEFVEHEVAEQGRKWSSLRSPF